MRCARRLGEGADAFLRRARHDVLLLELAARLEQDQRDLVREVVLQLGADVLIRAFGVPGHALEMRLDLRVVVDDEVIGLVVVPVELVVADLVLAEVRDVRGLGRGTASASQAERDANAIAQRDPAEARSCDDLLAGSGPAWSSAASTCARARARSR